MTIAPTNTDAIRANLQRLEDLLSATAKGRRLIVEKLRPGHPAREIQLAQLRDEASEELAATREAVQAAFKEAQEQARANINAARAEFARSAEGRDEIAALPGFAALVGALSSDALAQRLNDLLDSGLVGQARALAAVAQAKVDDNPRGQHGRLHGALHRAKTEALSPLEAATAAEAEYVSNAAATFGMFAGQIDGRVQHIMETGTDYASGNFVDRIL